ncbi:MAG: IS256 family transposase, partial [Deltaproteobacteria bacterium]|nr:IS256 family transposase [Deltaproteobacteria bacterium]
MEKYSDRTQRSPEKETAQSVLEEILREGARRLLQAAIENEVTEYLERYQHMTDTQGHRLAVRNGYLPKREIITGLGPV